MFQQLSSLILALSVPLLASTVLAAPSGTRKFGRSTDTCADPSASDIFVEAYSPSQIAHVFDRRSIIVNTDSVGQANWQIQGEIFRAWKGPQEGTVPMYRAFNPTTFDYIFITSSNGNPPVVSGFQLFPNIIAYVYPSPICGSIPLYATAQQTVGDHWYTTIPSERDDLVANGWIDSGIAAYVLPL
ncbi:hypothetical protein D9613_003606 [Agrocybe pediades]|uniref:DUF5648 domain-containing protein n=1 Tax=Agrocybe pediades TaxID=84607 RepID=A0A8H4QIQ5_9AGAR|nr:hypothetical protein D9613_003606 [Agrocybe pediades]